MLPADRVESDGLERGEKERSLPEWLTRSHWTDVPGFLVAGASTAYDDYGDRAGERLHVGFVDDDCGGSGNDPHHGNQDQIERIRLPHRFQEGRDVHAFGYAE